MRTYEQLRYIYLSNIACGDIGEADQAAMLAELEEIKASRQIAEKEIVPTQPESISKRKVAA